MNILNTIAGILLAGGQSKRMGRSKALLTFRGHSLLAHMVGLAKEVGLNTPCPILVSGHLPASDDYQLIADKPRVADTSQPDTEIDKERGLGPMAGILACLNALIQQQAQGINVQAALVIPVDMPCLSVETLRALCAPFMNPANLALLAYFRHHPLPFCVAINEETAAVVQQCEDYLYGRTEGQHLDSSHTSNESLSVQAFFYKLEKSIEKSENSQHSTRLHILDGSHPTIAATLKNTNTPEEWKEVTGVYPH